MNIQESIKEEAFAEALHTHLQEHAISVEIAKKVLKAIKYSPWQTSKKATFLNIRYYLTPPTGVPKTVEKLIDFLDSQEIIYWNTVFLSLSVGIEN
jgi:hypothetical protein